MKNLIGGKEPLETSYFHCDERGILGDRGWLDRAELPYNAAHGSPRHLPEENYLTQLIVTGVNNRFPFTGLNHVLA